MRKNRELEEPSIEYKDTIDDMLKRLAKGKLEYSPIDEIKKQYGLLH